MSGDEKSARKASASNTAKSQKTSNNPEEHATMRGMEADDSEAMTRRPSGFKLKKESKRTRVYRRAASDKLTDPGRSPRAEVNRLTKVTGLRLPPEDIDRIDRIAKSHGLKRTQWLAQIVMAEVERQETLLDKQNTNEPE